MSPSASSGQASGSRRSGKIRALIVDDSPGFRRELRVLLELEEILVVGEANNGWEAVELSEQLDPDVILMDQNMPALSGVAATRQIKHKQPWRRIIFIAAEGSWREEALSAGATATIDANTPNPFAFSLGNGDAQTFTAGNSRRIMVWVEVTAVNSSSSFTLAYDSTASSSRLDRPTVTVPEYGLAFVPVVLLFPLLAGGFWRRRKLDGPGPAIPGNQRGSRIAKGTMATGAPGSQLTDTHPASSRMAKEL